MKILRYVFYFLLLICLSTGVQAAKKIATLYIPAGSMGVLTGFQFNLSILTPEGAQYGVYQSGTTIFAVLVRLNMDHSLITLLVY